jgi:hypothetical protein
MDMMKIKKGINDPSGAIFYFHDKIERSISKVFFKNTAGFTNNIRGMLDYSRVKKIDNSKNISNNSIKKEFADKGYVKLGLPFEPKLISQISKKLDNYILDEKYSWIRAKHDETIYSRSLYRGHELIPESIEILNNEIISIIEQYYQTYFQVTKFIFYRNYHVPSEIANKTELMSSNWHCDASNTSWLKLFVYLTDVSVDDGPFNVQTRERTIDLMKLGYKNRGNYNLPLDVMEDEKYVWKASGKKGTALMCNCNLGLHKAGIPKPGRYRDVLLIQLAPSNEPLTKDWYKTFIDPNEPLNPNGPYRDSLDGTIT